MRSKMPIFIGCFYGGFEGEKLVLSQRNVLKNFRFYLISDVVSFIYDCNNKCLKIL